ncbi:MAG: c-type cytochrome [Chloroflexi bacterium]|nr:c-type cytochrome [Chloroflexota bacterium]
MRSRRLSIIVVAIGLIAMIGIACKSDVSEATRIPTPQFEPTAAGEVAPPPTQAPVSDDADEPVVDNSAGDSVNGEALFQSNACSGCHSTGDNRVVGPGLKGVFARAGDQVAGLSADEYLMNSIVDPASFIVDGFPNAMPTIFGSLAESDRKDLIAYLKTLE